MKTSVGANTYVWLLVAVLSLSLLNACSSSGDSNPGSTTDSGNGTTDGTTNGSSSAGNTDNAGNVTEGTTDNSNTDSGTTNAGDTSTGDTDTGNTDVGANVSLLDAGLSHTSTPIAAIAETANDPLMSTIGRDRADALPEPLGLIFEAVVNQGSSVGIDCSGLGARWNGCSVVNIHIKDANGTLNSNDWKLYFHSLRRILQVTSNDFTVHHVNGDLFYIAPNSTFSGFTDAVETLKLITEFGHVVESDFQPRAWVAQNGSVTLISNTDEETDETKYITKITGDNRFEYIGEKNPIADASLRFDRNSDVNTRAAALTPIDALSRVVPRPSSVVTGTGTLNIGNGFSFANLGLPANSLAALQQRQSQFMSIESGVPLQGIIDTSMAANSYNLNVGTDGISINASDQSMMFYASQTLLSLVQPGSGSIPIVNISDSPRFAYRGMHVDVARNFHSVESIKRLMDQMAAYKLNRLHLHLSDDEGWRLAIPGLPELTTVGGKRAFKTDGDALVTETESLMPAMGSGPNSNNQGSGFYTRAQYIDLLQYANARFIEVIPELDMPAHARSAVVAMRVRAYNQGNARNINIRLDDPDDQSRYLTVQKYTDSLINPCVPGTYNFIRTIVSEVKAMHDAANAPLTVWHMGGDEAINILLGAGVSNPDTSVNDQPWARSPVCESFIANTSGVNNRDDLTPYFVGQVAQIVADNGIPTLYAYHDIFGEIQASDLVTNGAGVNYWASVSRDNPSNAIAVANNFSTSGFETIIGAPDYLYFDFPYEVDPEERGYYWGARRLDSEKVFKFAPENLAQNAETSLDRDGNTWSATSQGASPGYTGMQGFLWSETIRTPEQFDYMLFPRTLAVAERAWHGASWERPYVQGEQYSATSMQVDTDAVNNDYASFANALGNRELFKLDTGGVQYRIPPPGAKVIGGQLQMNSSFPGLTMEYSLDGSSWQVWNSANPPATANFVRSKSADGNRVSRVTPVQ